MTDTNELRLISKQMVLDMGATRFRIKELEDAADELDALREEINALRAAASWDRREIEKLLVENRRLRELVEKLEIAFGADFKAKPNYECAVEWRDKFHAAEAEVAKLTAERDALRELVEAIDLTLRVPAAAYVPAIGDVFTLIDKAKGTDDAPST